MSHKTPKSLGELMFDAGSALGDLARQAAAQADLADHLRAALPPDLAGQLRGASIRPDGTLVLLASTPAWAARLRFEGDRLLGVCAGREPPARQVRVRVSTGTSD